MSLLGNIPLFSDFSDDERADLERHLVRRRYRGNTVLMEKGDETASLYVILEGSVRVYVTDDKTGKEIILNTQGPGEYFGELAILLDSPRTASVRTIENSVFLVLGKQWFETYLLEHPHIAYTLVRSLARRIVDLTEEVSSLALESVYERVRTVLISEAEEQPNKTLATGRITQQFIANRIGASREMVSRVLKDLKTGGYISLDKKKIVINKKLPAEW